MKRTQRPAFTLVELLVVIGIIALLISILLPALNKATRSAKAIACQSNMRQIGQAMFQYAQDNKFILPPQRIDPGVGGYPFGDYFAYMLVRGRYLSAPDATKSSPSDTSVFRCPEGSDEMLGSNWPNLSDYATCVQNFTWYALNDGTNVRVVGDVAVRSWYALNSGNQSYLPIRWVKKDSDLKDVKRITYKRGSELVMMTEGATWNQFYYPVRIAGRHGVPTNGGKDAHTNLLFFDGHVASYPTTMFQTSSQLQNYTAETIFRLDYAQ